MKPCDFEYVAPTSLAEAVDLLARDEDARVIAGGQSLVPMLNLRLAFPTTLVDITRLPGLGEVETDEDVVRIPAAVRQSRAASADTVKERVPLLAAALGHVGHPQTRSRGTVVGSLAHADPAAELPAVLVALDGELEVVGPNGNRTIAAADLYRGYYTTALEQGEIAIAVRLPIAPAGTGAGCYEISRRRRDFALLGAVAQLTLGGGRTVAEARVALFGVGPRPLRAESVEEALRGREASVESIAVAAEAIAQSTAEGGFDYRASVAPVVVRRALIEALEGVR
ncbi:MAG TPA: xanthine dehydrogenase family protein subunit M [Solirubrobacterales bacterium]|jgi:carbon-monoxide dehydrogenase medium subunit